MKLKEWKERVKSAEFEKKIRHLYAEKAKKNAGRYGALLDLYEKTFSSNDEITLFSAPGRTEIGGNHTDHQHGQAEDEKERQQDEVHHGQRCIFYQKNLLGSLADRNFRGVYGSPRWQKRISMKVLSFFASRRLPQIPADGTRRKQRIPKRAMVDSSAHPDWKKGVLLRPHEMKRQPADCQTMAASISRQLYGAGTKAQAFAQARTSGISDQDTAYAGSGTYALFRQPMEPDPGHSPEGCGL